MIALLKNRKLRLAVGWLIMLLIFGFLASYFLDQWQQIQVAALDINQPIYVLAILGFTLGMGLMPLGSWIMLRGLGASTIGFAEVWHAFYVGQMTKYLPGGFWSVPSRAYLYTQRGLPMERSIESMFWETGLPVCGAVITALPGMPLLRDSDILPLVIAGLYGFMVVYLIVGFLLQAAPVRRWMQSSSTRFTRLLRIFDFHLPAITALRLIAFYAVNWFLIGIGFILVVRSLGIETSAAQTLQLACLFAGGWAAGFLFIFTPGGIGIRDAVLAIGVGVLVDDPLPVLVAVLARLCWMIAETVGFGLATLWLYRTRRSHEPAPDS